MTAWYQKHLGFNTNPYGTTFDWYEGADSTKKAQTQWTPFAETTKYFEPLNGIKNQTLQKKHLHNGVHFQKIQNTLRHQQKNS